MKKFWTSERIEELRRMVEGKILYSEIALEMRRRHGETGTSLSSVRRIIEIHCRDLRRRKGPRAPVGMYWHDHRIERLRALLKTDQTYAEIAATLTAEFGMTITRSSISGAVARFCRDVARETRMVKRPPSNKIEWTTGMDACISTVLDRRGTLLEIVLELQNLTGRTYSTHVVSKRARALGLSVGPPRGEAFRVRPAGQHLRPQQGIFCEEYAPGRTILEIPSDGCRWPLHGSGRDMEFCTEVATVRSYCLRHAVRAYRLPPDRERRGRWQ